MTRDQIIEKIFTLLGFKVTEEGVMTVTNKFAEFFAVQLVREGKMLKIDTHTYVKA